MILIQEIIRWFVLIVACIGFAYHWTRERNGPNVFWMLWFFFLGQLSVIRLAIGLSL